jgi:hypothetical protein
MQRRYLLWDHDGVLVDTERLYFEATRKVLGTIGVELLQDTYLEYMAEGRLCWDLARSRGISEGRIAEHRARRNSLYQEMLRSERIEIAGVKEVLAAHERGLSPIEAPPGPLPRRARTLRGAPARSAGIGGFRPGVEFCPPGRTGLPGGSQSVHRLARFRDGLAGGGLDP